MHRDTKLLTSEGSNRKLETNVAAIDQQCSCEFHAFKTSKEQKSHNISNNISTC